MPTTPPLCIWIFRWNWDTNPGFFGESKSLIAPKRIRILFSLQDAVNRLEIRRATAVRAIKRLIESGQIERIYSGHHRINLHNIPKDNA